MTDPGSIVGLTLAVFDQLLKICERSVELSSDIQHFKDDMTNLHDTVKYENSRTKALRSLLFEPSKVYFGQSLFEQFNEDIQAQIRSFLGQLFGVLSHVTQLLEKRYGTAVPSGGLDESTSSASPSNAPASAHPLKSDQFPSEDATAQKPVPIRRSRSPLLMLRWSFYDKKQIEKIVREFADLNSRILDHIKLLCLGSAIGVDMPHLENLQTNKNSKTLGFDLDATLKIAADDSQSVTHSLVLQNAEIVEQLQRTIHEEGEIAVIDTRSSKALTETYPGSLSPEKDHHLDLRIQKRVDALARLLQQPKEQIFRIPRCIGWNFVSAQNCIVFLFEIPEGVRPQPISLLALLRNMEVKMALGNKFQLAHGLAQCMAQLHLVRWVHESFRSENIIFFPRAIDPSSSSVQNPVKHVNFAEPWVLGFAYSRTQLDFSAGLPDYNPARDVYRHPERQGTPQQVFNKIHDIYALGVVLLEIGLWQPAITLEKNEFAYAKDPKSIKARLILQATQRLESKVGSKYKAVVLRCLTGDFGVIENDSKEDLKLQQSFRENVVDVLKRAADNV